VLGGGGFLGYHAVRAALDAGHEVTVFSRSADPPMSGVDVIQGDRRGGPKGLSGLCDRRWDAVFDTFTDTDDGAPAVAATADLLRDRVDMYGYVSGMSVYAPHGPAVPDESAPVRREGEHSDRLQERSLAKLAGERVVTQRFADRALFPRVGIMVGPRGRRYTYWPVRFARALRGELPRTVLVPGDLDRDVQYSDARDIAGWVVEMLAEHRGGTYNTVGPGRPESLRTVLDACLRAVGGAADDVALVNGDEGHLRRKLTGVDEEDRPLWFPEDQIPQIAIDSSAAIRAGLRFRSALDTARDTATWAAETGDLGLTDGAVIALEHQLIAETRAD
jgi:2'-hydroxyisoflavone reductase